MRVASGMKASGVDAGRRNNERPLARRVVAVGRICRHGRRVTVTTGSMVVVVGELMLTWMVLHVGLVLTGLVMRPFRRWR